MKSLKTIFAAITLTTLLAVSTTFADPGILISDLSGGNTPTPCTEGNGTKNDQDTGIIIAGLTGIIIAGFTGIIIAGATDNGPVNCGIIIAG